jgi:dihydropyrimidine dehydrogenase (NAD+) subunit PreA
MMLGAGTIQVTTAVMQYGYRIIEDLKSGLNYFLARMGLNSVEQVVGLGVPVISSTTDVLERNSIQYPKIQREMCIGCGRCVISCADGGHQALRLNEQRKPVMNARRCVGCHLCMLVCPQNAIIPGRRVVKPDKKEGLE